MFHIELVWNREFDFVRHGAPFETMDLAIAAATALENSGDGERVKKTRIVDNDGTVVGLRKTNKRITESK